MNFYLKQWRLFDVDSGIKLEVTVPGDITNDLHKAGLITDPYYGYNHHECYDMCRKDYVYTTEFDLPKEVDFNKENFT